MKAAFVVTIDTGEEDFDQRDNNIIVDVMLQALSQHFVVLDINPWDPPGSAERLLNPNQLELPLDV